MNQNRAQKMRGRFHPFFRMFYAFFLFLCSTASHASEIYDCFTFFNEFELLKVRLEELYDVVDYFVLTEATHTFSGEPKPLFFLEHRDKYEKYKKKIIHVIVDDFPAPTSNPYQDRWVREEFQHNASFRALGTCHDDDIIFISDLDEIPSRQAVCQVKEYFQQLQRRPVKNENRWICQLHMKLLLFFLNYESSYGWNGAVKATPFGILKRKSIWSLKILHQSNLHLHQIHNAGWHFHSLVGEDLEKLVQKLRASYLHTPSKDFCFGEPQGWLADLSKMETWENHSGDFVKWSIENNACKIVPIDCSYPQYILDHLEYFRDLGWIKK